MRLTQPKLSGPLRKPVKTGRVRGENREEAQDQRSETEPGAFTRNALSGTEKRQNISMERVKLIECPRDAWQGLPEVIPTETKAKYVRELILAGFAHIDAVSFVSPKHVRQMADSEEVMARLMELLEASASSQTPEETNSSDVRSQSKDRPLQDSGALLAEAQGKKPPLTEIIGIVVNEKGLERALATPGVTTIGYPYSISAYFRRANANMTRAESRKLVETLKRETKNARKNLVIYISMAFGNPYEEPWGPEIVQDTLEWLKDIRVTAVSLADTVGTATPELVRELYATVKDHVAGMELGVHLHSRTEKAEEKVLAAYAAGCRRFDSALTGLGGCPFAGDELVGNIATESVVAALEKAGAKVGVNSDGLAHVVQLTTEIRQKYAHGRNGEQPLNGG